MTTMPTLMLTAALATAPCTVTSPAHRVALVELYTSQGCSSCPPADRWLSTLSQRLSPAQAVPLALHVGYWDDIGWKDPFAQRVFNERQRELATASGSRTVYTPGVFVQGREMPRWSREAEFMRVVRAVNAEAAPVRIDLAARLTGAQMHVDVSAVESTAGAARDARLYLALTQSGLQTSVRAGENRGETLGNDHVVRTWSGALPLGRHAFHWAPPAGVADDRLALVAFVQSPAGEVLQALRWQPGACKER